MKRSIGIFGLLAVSAMSVFGQTAREYAAQLSTLLAEYQEKLTKKITAEQTANDASAKLYDDAARENGFAVLGADRNTAAKNAIAALREGRMAPEKLLEDVVGYTQRDFAGTKMLYGLPVDSYKSYLASLRPLVVDFDKVDLLITRLDALASPVKLKTRLAEIESFGEDFLAQTHFSNCSLADSLLAIKSGRNGSREELAELKKRRAASGGFTPDDASGDTGKCEVK